MTYSRYADDITFSSNIAFSKDFVYWDEQENIWVAGNVLEKELNKAGFKINPNKTRYSTYSSRQFVTGLIVNKNTNVTPEYKKQNRAMVHSLITTGEFYIPTQTEKIKGHLNQLIGRLNHTIYAKYYQPILDVSLSPNERKEIKDKNGQNLIQNLNKWQKGHTKSAIADHQTKLLRNVLFYKYFIGINKTKIFTEGITDPIYFKTAANKLGKKGSFSFQSMNKSLAKLGLMGGTPNINKFLINLEDSNFITLQKFKVNSDYPAIFILDYDKGLDSCEKIIKEFNDKEPHEEQFIYFNKNIYILLLQVYQGKDNYKNNPTCIENLITYNNNCITTTGSKNESIKWENKEISKMDFSKIVRSNPDDFNFDKFTKLFDLIHKIEEDYQKRLQDMQIGLTQAQ